MQDLTVHYVCLLVIPATCNTNSFPLYSVVTANSKDAEETVLQHNSESLYVIKPSKSEDTGDTLCTDKTTKKDEIMDDTIFYVLFNYFSHIRTNGWL